MVFFIPADDWFRLFNWSEVFSFFYLSEKHFTLIGWENNAFRMLPFAYASIRNRIVFLHISLKSTKRYNVWKIYSNANNLNNFKNGSTLHKEILKWTKSSKYIEVNHLQHGCHTHLTMYIFQCPIFLFSTHCILLYMWS